VGAVQTDLGNQGEILGPNVRVSKIDTKCSVDLNVDVARRDNAAAALDHLGLAEVAVAAALVETFAGVDDHAVQRPYILLHERAVNVGSASCRGSGLSVMVGMALVFATRWWWRW
jgi:hypothetical protein